MKSCWTTLTIVLVFMSAQAWSQAERQGGTSLPMTAAADHAPIDNSHPQFQDRYPRYHLEPGDTVALTFEFSPEFNQTVTVQPDGFITLRGLGDLHVADQTVPELTQTLKIAYSKILKDPSIAVVLQEFEKPYFVAGGQVAKPGKYDLHGETTVVQAIQIAGGFLQSSKHSQVLLFRRANNGLWETKILNVKKMLVAKNLTEDMYLRPGDMLFVPQNKISKISKFLPNPGMGVGVYANPKP